MEDKLYPEIVDEMLELLPKHSQTFRISTISKAWGLERRSIRRYFEMGQIESVPMPGEKRDTGVYVTTRSALKRFLIDRLK